MKNYLLLLKQQLLKNKNVYVQNQELIEDKDEEQNVNIADKKIKDIAKSLELEFVVHDLSKIKKDGVNAYNMDDNLVFFYPVNDARPTCPFEFYKNNKLIIHNQNVFSEITNLDEIILQLVRIFNKSLDLGIVIDPYFFMLKLEGDIKENYKGKATLVITEKAIRNHKLNKENFTEANKYFINRFLDHFIGWNFGVSVNRNEILKNELELLNIKVIEKGIREDAGSGFEVYGTDKEVYQGLQHYYLPNTENIVKTKK